MKSADTVVFIIAATMTAIPLITLWCMAYTKRRK